MTVGVGGMAVGGGGVLVGRGDGVTAIVFAVQPDVNIKKTMRKAYKMLLTFECCIVIIYLRLWRRTRQGLRLWDGSVTVIRLIRPISQKISGYINEAS